MPTGICCTRKDTSHLSVATIVTVLIVTFKLREVYDFGMEKSSVGYSDNGAPQTTWQVFDCQDLRRTVISNFGPFEDTPRLWMSPEFSLFRLSFTETEALTLRTPRL